MGVDLLITAIVGDRSGWIQIIKIFTEKLAFGRGEIKRQTIVLIDTHIFAWVNIHLVIKLEIIFNLGGERRAYVWPFEHLIIVLFSLHFVNYLRACALRLPLPLLNCCWEELTCRILSWVRLIVVTILTHDGYVFAVHEFLIALLRRFIWFTIVWTIKNKLVELEALSCLIISPLILGQEADELNLGIQPRYTALTAQESLFLLNCIFPPRSVDVPNKNFKR